MERWHTSSGLPWLHHEREGAAATDPHAHVAGVVLGRGYAHQPVRHLGVADVVADLLRRELAGPVESSAGGVDEVGATVRVDLQDTLVLLTGTEAALRRRLRHLEEVLAEPDRLELPDRRPERPGRVLGEPGHPYAGAGREVAAWFGAGAASLSCDLDPTGSTGASVGPGTVRDALAALSPEDAPAVGLTTAEGLVGCAFGGTVADGPPTALRWRAPGPGSLTGAAPTGLLSLCAGTTAAAEVALRILVDVVRDALRRHEVPIDGARVATSRVGDRRLVVLQAVPGERRLADPRAAHRAVVDGLAACRGLAPARLQQELYEAQRAAGPVPGSDQPLALARDTVRSGVRQGSRERRRALAEATPDDVARELATLLDRVLVTQPTGAEPPEGYPVLTPPPEPPGSAPDGVHPVRPPVRLGTEGHELTRVERHGSRLVLWARPSSGHGRREEPLQELDLDRVVARFDQGDPGGPGTTTLVDVEDHRVLLPWAALGSRRALRRAVDAATDPSVRVGLPEDRRWAPAVRRRRRSSPRAGVGVAAALAVVAVVVGYAVDDPADSATTIEEVRFGETGELSNGTTLEVSELREADGGGGLGPLRLADVRFCGGGPTRVEDSADSARNYVSPGRFVLEGTPNNTLTQDPPGVDLLREATLAEGDCLEGTIGFQVPADTPSAGVAVRYANGLGDQITWR